MRSVVLIRTEVRFAVVETISGRPSLLKSATATETGSCPGMISAASVNFPSPVERRTESPLGTVWMRSDLPSPFISAITGFGRLAVKVDVCNDVLDTAAWKVLSPFPKTTE
jgi:hypothetical protein